VWIWVREKGMEDRAGGLSNWAKIMKHGAESLGLRAKDKIL